MLDEQCLSLKAKNYSLADVTQRRLWENLRDLRDVSEETSLINLQGDVSEICKSALFETSQRCVWDAPMPAGHVLMYLPLFHIVGTMVVLTLSYNSFSSPTCVASFWWCPWLYLLCAALCIFSFPIYHL